MRKTKQIKEKVKFPRRRKRLKLFVFNVLVIGLLLYVFEFVFFLIDPARKLDPDGAIDGSRYTWGSTRAEYIRVLMELGVDYLTPSFQPPFDEMFLNYDVHISAQGFENR